MIAAIADIAANGEPRPTLVFAGVVDEEYQMRGSRALVDQLPESPVRSSASRRRSCRSERTTVSSDSG